MNMEVLSTVTVGKTALVTTDCWFTAPDGKDYKAVFGTIHGVDTAEASLGVRSNSRSTNWYLRIGNMIIAGCQIHYVLRTDKVHLGETDYWNHQGGVEFTVKRPCSIYSADGVTEA